MNGVVCDAGPCETELGGIIVSGHHPNNPLCLRTQPGNLGESALSSFAACANFTEEE